MSGGYVGSIRGNRYVSFITRQYSSLRYLRDRRLAVLGTVNFLDRMSISIIAPLLPIYVNELGADAVLLGVIWAASTVAESAFATPFGYLADKTGRRLPITAGVAISGVSIMLFGLVSVPVLFIAFRMLDGMGTALRGPATNSYIGDSYPTESRGQAFGAYHTLGMAGLGLGPLVGGVFAAAGSISLPFVLLGGLTASGSILLVLLLPPAKRADDTDSEDVTPLRELSRSEIADLFTLAVVIWVVASFVSSIGTAAFYPMLSVLLEFNGFANFGYLGVVWAAFGFGLFVFMPVGGTIADRVGRKKILVATGMLWVVIAFGLSLAFHPVIPVVLLFAGGMASGLSAPAGGALQYEIIPDERYIGTLIGFFGTISSVGGALGPVLSGYVVDFFDVEFLFVVMGASWIITTLMYFGLPEVGETDADAT